MEVQKAIPQQAVDGKGLKLYVEAERAQ